MEKFLIPLLLLLLALATATEDEQHTKWVRAVEEILSGVMLGPLKEEFTPSYLARRTREASLKAQTNRFRARVATAMAESLEDHVIVCRFDHIGQSAVDAVIAELRNHTFHSHYETGLCGARGGIYVALPEPKQ